MRLFLDDVRPTPEGYDARAYTATEAIELLKTGKVTYISFDHDLGEEAAGTGYQVACWLESAAYFAQIPPLKWAIHSANPVGRRKIEAAMRSAERYWEQGNEHAKLDTNSTLENRKARDELNCSFCRPHKGENQTYSKRGVRKPRKKDHR